MEITVKQKKILELVEKKRTKNEQRELIKLLKEEETKGKKNEKKAWAVWGGEGDTGRMRIVQATERGIKRVLTAERCNGARWAHACPIDYEHHGVCVMAREWYGASNLSN